MRRALSRHWPEYLMEAAGLGAFMLSACVFAALLERASDIAHGQTRVATEDGPRAAAALDRAGARWISPGLVAVPGAPDGSRRGGLVRDPDGHAVQIVER